MISYEYKCIFIHIPKCAGTSIELALGHSKISDGIKEPDHRSVRMVERPLLLPKVMSSRENIFQFALRCCHTVQSHRNPNNRLTVSIDQYKSYFKFTIVRNPWTRAYSWYKNCMRDPNHRARFGLNDGTSLNDFLSKHIGRGALRPQISWIRDFDGRIPMDYIARFESLEVDFQRVCEALRISQVTLPHDRKGSRVNYRRHFDKRSIDLIREVYKAEINLFDYSFEG